jgi:hypothetical protein
MPRVPEVLFMYDFNIPLFCKPQIILSKRTETGPFLHLSSECPVLGFLV